MIRTRARPRLQALWAVVVIAGLAASAGPASAQIGSERYAAIVTDARSGAVLYAASPDEQRYPASLTKMMTLYLAFEALRDGRTQMDRVIPVSYEAASMPPSRLGLTAGSMLTVEDAVMALITKSANDAATALGEYLGGGSEDRFAQMMTLRARALGMRSTTFRNASGLPDADQVTTARDMALLGRRLMQDFPQRYALFSTPWFQYRGRTLWNHNHLLQEYDGADGIKTGYVNDSGFNLVASAQRENVRLVAAVFGGRTGRERDRHMMVLLDQGFAQLGVAPRAPMVAMREGPPAAPGRRGSLLVGSAGAATLARGAPHGRAGRPTAAQVRLVAAAKAKAGATRIGAPPAAARGSLLRLASTTTPRGGARIEQGDTSRGSVRATHAAAHQQPVKPTRPAKPKR